jgi:hypothetical protein
MIGQPGVRWLAALVGLGLAWGLGVRADEPVQAPGRVKAQALPAEKSLRKARVGGKYEMLLRQIKVPADAARYADFRDLGSRELNAYAGFTDLPRGYWVYVYPYWYIWRDLAASPKAKRPWGPEQATGPPDTPTAGDIQTAWASRTPDDQDEWLLLEYAEPVVPEAVAVYETYNPGALYRVTVFKLDGEEVEVWKGKDPTPVNSGKGVSEVTFRVPFKTNRVKIYLDSRNVPGWNEIDAVGLRDTGGKTHWAVSAHASSTYAEGAAAPVAVPVRVMVRPVMPVPAPVGKPAPLPAAPAAPPPAAPAPATPEARLRRLQAEVRDLKKALADKEEELKKLEDQLKKP